MHLAGSPPKLVLSATDLSGFLACRHLTALDLAVALGEHAKPAVHDDPLLEVLRQRGLDHERRFIESLRAAGHGVLDLTTVQKEDNPDATLEAMRAGVPVIYQGALEVGQFFGKPDVIRRIETPSDLGPYSYEIWDTKLARETRAATILQLGLYSEMLGLGQGRVPECFHVVTPDVSMPEHHYRVSDYAAYVRSVRDRMLQAVTSTWQELEARHYPDPVAFCELCRWAMPCRDRRRADDHVSLVAGISRSQRTELAQLRGITTMTELAGLELPIPFKPKRGSRETYARVRTQARLQVDSRDASSPLHELILPVEKGQGLCRLPEPSPGDIFLDLEGDPFAVEEGGGREYLFGVALPDGSYQCRWAFSEAEERKGFEWVMAMIVERAARFPDMHVYHYAPYEPSAFKRLMGRYATRERELDAMLRAGRFVDLYAVVRHGVRAGVERYSIKNLEPLYAFERAVPLDEARRGLRRLEHALEVGAPDAIPAADRETVQGYNRDDCVSTLRLRDWLEQLRLELVGKGTEVPRPLLESGDATPELDARAQRVEALRARLLDGVSEMPDGARWLLAYMLDYHRREDKSTWWEYYRLCKLSAEELYDEREALAGLEFVERVGQVVHKKSKKPTGTVIDRYRYPEQDVEIEPDDKLKLQDEREFGEVVDIDRVARTIDVKKGKAVADEHPSAVFAFRFIRSEAMEEALYRIGEALCEGKEDPDRLRLRDDTDACHPAGEACRDLLSDGKWYGAARALLTREPPRLSSGPFARRDGEEESHFAVRIATDLDETVLAIQGPPGAGKTYTGARMICALLRAGKRVGVTATGHKVIRNLLDEVAEAARELGAQARVGHKIKEEADPSPANGIVEFTDNGDALGALHDGKVNVLGGTAWMWAREDFASSVDVLFVDEAGQMALANVVAVSQAAKSLVLLGDPQQLEQPRKGSHPEGVGVSALEHYLGGKQTIPPECGIFLPVTWRLAPAICDFTSELFYEGRLTPKAGLERQRLEGGAALPASGLLFLPVEHEGNRSSSDEEVEAVAELVERLTTTGVRWTDAAGVASLVKGEDILVVAPYNAQVTRLAERLSGTGVRVGTVDKFQGQEAPVVIYSMATSSSEDAPRGMEFLYSLNRLNVATSRAKCLGVVVASPKLLEPECRSPRQMKLANGLCRLVELSSRTSERVPAAGGRDERVSGSSVLTK